MKHFTITLKPEGKQISIHSGATLVEAAGQAGIILNTVCGGRGTCKKCIAYLEPEGRKVLACNYRIQSDLVVTIPRDSRFFEQQILTEGADAEPGIEPDIYQAYTQAAAGGAILGVAVDIGTTTVVVRLVDMTDGQCLAAEAALNPQTKFGDDVVTRIAYAETDEKFTELREAITGCINDLVSKLCEKTAVDTDSIFEICIVGNTTMNHIFLGLPIMQLGRAPYKAYSLDARDLTAGESALLLNAAGNVHTVENIAGFVGSDTTAVALASGIDTDDEMTLAVDIGTNGEIVLGTRNKLYAASCAAGPAFEGARISCGGRAAEGAIEAVVLGEDDIDLDVIGNCPPRSLCGSGLIDAVAVLLELGIIESTGRFAEPQTLRDKLPPAIFSRISQQDGQPAFCLAGDGKAGTVLLTQRDIRETQLAKAAIRAGIRLLQKRMGLKDSDVKHILLAGAFGNYIRRESALRVGLLPSVDVDRIRSIGNAAASGAQMILLSRYRRNRAGELARRIEYVEIAHEPDFHNFFADSLIF